MREIKYRFYEASDGKMYYFTLNDILNRLGIKTGGDGSFSAEECPSALQPRMEFTGLKDKNGVEIYEGDIIKHPEEGCYAEVIWTNSVACSWEEVDGMLGEKVDLTGFMTTLGQFSFRQFGRKLHRAYHLQDLEVIGNIYENPGLLTTQ